MLGSLKRNIGLPVPEVLHADGRLLTIEYLATSGGIGPTLERHAAALLAALHRFGAPDFGLERDIVLRVCSPPNGTDADLRPAAPDGLRPGVGEFSQVNRLRTIDCHSS